LSEVKCFDTNKVYTLIFLLLRNCCAIGNTLSELRRQYLHLFDFTRINRSQSKVYKTPT